MTAVCHTLFIFCDFESSFPYALIGGYAEQLGATSMRIGESKTIPGREKKPEPNRRPRLGVRCHTLFTGRFWTTKIPLFRKESDPERISIDNFCREAPETWYGCYTPREYGWDIWEKSYIRVSYFNRALAKSMTPGTGFEIVTIRVQNALSTPPNSSKIMRNGTE